VATGYKIAGGADLDTLFMGTVYADNMAPPPIGYKVANGYDLSRLFVPYTTGAQVAPTGYKVAGGADISTRFQNINVPLQPLSISKSGDAYGFGVGPIGSITASTNTVTITAAGGTSPYSFSWALVSGIAAAAVGTPQVRYWSRTLDAGIYVGTYRCTVTDSVGGTAAVDVVVTTEHEALGP
jgi:hypothetical protein